MSFRNFSIMVTGIILIAFLPVDALRSQEVVDVGEIYIKVEAEEPTVVIFIPRLSPDINIAELRRPVEAMIYNKPSRIKPRLTSMSISQVENMNRLLKQSRTHLRDQERLRPDMGWLTITSNPPGARITAIDNQKILGRTPLYCTPLRPGKYDLLLEKEFYESYETSIEIDPESDHIVDAELTHSSGNLEVSTDPEGTKIYIDNNYLGESPWSAKEIAAGKHELRLEKPGYDIQTDQVLVKRNETTKYSAALGTTFTDEWKSRRSRARLYSLFAPGSGQFLSGQYLRGGIYGGAIIGTLVLAYMTQQLHSDAKSEFNHEIDAYHNINDQPTLDMHMNNAVDAWNDMKSAEDRINTMWMVIGGIYALQILDAWIWGGGKRQEVRKSGIDLSFQPYTSPGMRNNVVGVTISCGN